MDIIDSVELGNVDGFELRAEIIPDDDSTPDEYGETYSRLALAAYQRGDWNYVGIIVTASRAGIDLGSDSIWAVEYGLLPLGDGEVSEIIDPLRDENGSLAYYKADLIDNAVADARMQLAALTDSEA